MSPDSPPPVDATADGGASGAGRRVLIIFHEAEYAGASRAVVNVASRLQGRGWELVFWTPSPGPARDELEARGYAVGGAPRLLRYGWRSLSASPGAAARLRSAPGYLRSLRAFAADQGPDIVHANTLITIPELLAARGRRRASLMYVHEILPAGVKGEAAARLIRAGADKVVSVSSAGVAALRAHGVPAQLVHNGVPAPTVAPHRVRGDRRPVVGLLGTVCHRKGSDLFLAAAERVREVLPEVEFRLRGQLAPGPEYNWAQELVARAGASQISWGISSDVYSELAEWDVLVMPSRQEPLGLSALEAMAMGVPVVAADTGGLPEIVDPASGLLVAPESVEALTAAILALARDPGRRQRLGAAGRARVAQSFGLDQQAEGVHRAYLSALSGSRGVAAAVRGVPGGEPSSAGERRSAERRPA